MSSKAARTLVTLLRQAALAPRIRAAMPARVIAATLCATVVAGTLAPAATYALDPSTSTVLSSASSALAGSVVTYSTTVAAPAGSPTPTGTVTVRDGAVTIGTCGLVSGACAVSTTTLAVGTHGITASYGGDAAHDPSTSPLVLQTIAAGVRAGRAAATTASSGQTSLVVTAPAGATTGDALIAAVTVTGGTGTVITATGWTRLTGSDLSSGTLLRQGLFYRVRTATDASSYTFTFSSAQKASAVIVAVAGGDGATPRSVGSVFASATSFTLPTLALGGATSGVALGFLGVGVGTTIASVANGYVSVASIAATGGKASTQTTSGAAQLTLTDATSVIGARFTTGAAGVAIGHTVVVGRAAAATLTRITSGAATATVGSAALYTARVDPTTATGSVAFLLDGGSTIGTCPLVGGTCSASLSLPAGLHTVSARYVPTPTALLTSTSSTVSVNVARAASSVSLTQSTSSTVKGATASFRIAVSGGVNATTGTGPVRLLEGSQVVAQCTLVAGACDATTATLAVGAHTLTAAFDGDANLEPGTSGSLIRTITKAPSSIAFSATPASATYGGTVTLTATVTSSGGIPTGSVAFSDGGVALTTCTLGTGGTPGACSVTTNALAVATHPLTATYGGDTDFLAAGPAAQTVSVAKASSSISVSSSPAIATAGAAVTIRATVATGDGSVATGTVSFSDGSASLGPCTLGTVAPGVCQIVSSTLSVGDHLITAMYGGDATHTGNSVSYTQSIGRAATTTTLTSSAATSGYGSSVTFTVGVTSPAGTPTGQVAISDGTTPLATCSLTSGTCAVSTAALAAGNHTITASYLGDPTRAPGTTSISQLVTPAVTTTALAVAGTLTYGGAVTLTATLDRTAATGTVTFTDGTTALGSCILGSGGIAGRCTFATTALPAGQRSIVAAYLGDANHAASASAAATPTVARATPAISLSKTGGPAYGSTLVFTAVLDRTAATGTVSFSDGTTGIGTCTVGTLAPGSCTLSIATLAVGTHGITARYGGDPNFLPVTSASVTATVTQATSATVVSVAVSSALVGDAVLFSATVSPATATGSIEFRDGTGTIGGCTLAGGTCSGTASFPTKGTKSVTAAYLGDANLAGSTSATPASVLIRASSTTALATDVAASVFGQSVTLTATVTGADGGSPAGRISFSDGSRALGSCDLAAGALGCSLPVASLNAGVRTLTARYEGDGSYGASTGSATVTVAQGTSTTTVATSASTVVALTPVTFTVAVTTGDGSVATGTVAVSDGTTSIATCVLSSGVCTVTTDQLGVGAHTINATYLGAPNHAGSTASVAQTVTAIATTTTAVANPTTAAFGSPVTLTATVSPSAATGAVTFAEGGTTYGSCSILASSPGTCSYTTSSLPVGARSITVRYAGDTRYGSSSASVAVTITKANATISLATSASTGTFGTMLTFTASVAPSSATGTISFSDGTTGIGTCTLTAGSYGVCTLATSALSVGTHQISARYGGSTTLNASGVATLTQTVAAAATSTSIVTSASTTTAGSGTVTVTVTPSVATGVVAITDNGSQFAACTLVAGSCTVSLATLPLGAHTLVASYAGTSSYEASTSPLLIQTVSIGYRAVSAATTGSQTLSSLGIAVPATATAGDVLVAAVSAASSSVTIGAPGWTRLGSDLTSGTLTQALLWRVATSGDIGTTLTVTFSAQVKASAVLIAVGGAAASAPTTFASQANAVATQIATPALTPSALTRGMTLIFGGLATGSTVTSVGAGYTFPTGGEAATSGGQVKSMTAAAYGAPGTYTSIAASQIATGAASPGAASVGSTVFLAQGPTQ